MSIATADTLGADLFEHLIFWVHEAPKAKRLQWVMNGEWLNECRRMTDGSGHPRNLMEPAFRLDGPDYLLGVPVDVRDDGGVPHLEELI
jgi:HK97 family phage major capsid protein